MWCCQFRRFHSLATCVIGSDTSPSYPCEIGASAGPALHQRTRSIRI